jgi:hypothetical protein
MDTMKSAVLAVTLVVSGCSSMPEDPLYYTMQATRAVDMCTTLGVADNPSLKETNPILGESPSDGEVVLFGLAGMAVQHWAYKKFEESGSNSHKWFAGAMTLFNGAIIANNYKAGAKCP